ncbi:PTS sugar transporter subunit IIA [Neobacillus vireti]|uniref:Ascorbate-specific PTS system EIIA component n=1 Tax=Neobacillus vireti LMG 21834 TaxID=1131730 RepID=A0AB94IT44_9BACI|nr:PTS sugar transporter subunit IIA [Neobacillus vireti]ETI70167.1 transcriptional antiterminator BglG [Neobacillus vireti LMG 21834]
MLKKYLTEEMVQFKEEAKNWEEAIQLASEPLLKNHLIEKEYIDTMIENVKNLGPYIVLLPKFAMPHARPENGVNQLGLSLLILENGVQFDGGKFANVFLVLAAPDKESHLTLLSELSTVLSSQEKVDALASAKNYQEIFVILEEEAK